MEDIIIENLSNGEFQNMKNDGLLFSGDASNRIQDAENLRGNGGFTAAVNELFPNGIANSRSGIQRSKGEIAATTNLITPRTSKPVLTSTRGGRGGSISFSRTNRYLQLKQSTTTSELRGNGKKTRLNAQEDIDTDASMNNDSTDGSTQLGWGGEEEEFFTESFEDEEDDVPSDYNDRNNGKDQDKRQDVKGKNDFGNDNDFTKASSLLRTTTTTNIRNETTHELDGTTWTNNKENERTELQNTNERNNGIAQTKPEFKRSLGIASGKNAKEILMETEVLQVGPSDYAPRTPKAPTQKFYKYNMQVTFSRQIMIGGNKVSKGNYHVPSHFKQLVKQFNLFSPAITLLPYNTNGIPITSADQLPDEEIEEYVIYYHNHRVTASGQLTGMCCIESPFAWYQLKDERKPLFKWLRDRGVYMKYVSFKADQVSAAGWFYGLSPDVLRMDETKNELRQRLGAKIPSDLEFQLGTRMLSVTDKVTRNRFTFKGIAVECERNRVRELQEALYQMESPKEARYTYGITGRALFVPFIESEIWSNKKLLNIAKAHVQEMSKLGQAFLQNVQDIDQLLTWKEGDEESLRIMLANCTTIDGYQMIHSVHKTNREGTVAILYYKEFKQEVHSCFQDIQNILADQLSEESKGKLAKEGKSIIMTGSQNYVESSSASREYATYADIILEGMNPQGGEEEEEEIMMRSPPRKKQAQRKTPTRLSYSQVAQPGGRKGGKQEKRPRAETNGSEEEISGTDDSSSEDKSKNSTIIETLQQRLDKMQAQFEKQFGKVVGTDMEATQALIEANNKKIQKQSEEFFEQKFEELSGSLTKEIQRSNDLIFDKFAALTAQQNTALLSLQEAMKQEFKKVYANMANLQSGRSMENFSSQALGIVAMPGREPQASDGRK